MTERAPSWFAGPLRRRMRRALVVLAAIAITIALLLTQRDGWLANSGFWVGLALWIVIAIRVDRSMQGLPRKAAGRLDERELALRDDCHYRAYRVISALGVLALLVAVLATEVAERGALGVTPQRALIVVLVGYVAVVLNLPWMTLAWRLPDPVPEGEA